MQLREAAARMELDDEPPSLKPSLTTCAERYTWALLLARIYDCLPFVCPRGGQAMRIVAFVTTLTPLEVLAKLAALIPPPLQHRVRYYGVLAPHAGGIGDARMAGKWLPGWIEIPASGESSG